MNCAVYIDACTDVGKVALLPTIKDWIMIEELPLTYNWDNSSGQCNNFFQKLKGAFSALIQFSTNSVDTDPVWVFSKDATQQTVYYYHSLHFDSSVEIPACLQDRLLTVNTIVHSGAFEDIRLLSLCPRTKFYVTNGDGCDCCRGQDCDNWIQKTLNCKAQQGQVQLFYLPDNDCAELLFWNVLYNKPVEQYQLKFQLFISELCDKLQPISCLDSFFFGSSGPRISKQDGRTHQNCGRV